MEFNVRHSECANYISGKGNFEIPAELTKKLQYISIKTKFKFNKYNIFKRFIFEMEFAVRLIMDIYKYKPDIVIFCNIPLFAVVVVCNSLFNTPYIYWHQDIYSVTINQVVSKKLPFFSKKIIKFITFLEKLVLVKSAFIVSISHDFDYFYKELKLDTKKIKVIENWAPLNEIIPTSRENPWSIEKFQNSLDLRLVYAGTLGLKHNPQLLLELIRELRKLGVGSSITIIAEGEGVEYLKTVSKHTDNIDFLNYQPYRLLSDVLSSFDAAIVLLEKSASAMSIPSKVLTHFSAANAVCGLMPLENQAAIQIEKLGGVVFTPDKSGALSLARWLSSVTIENLREQGIKNRLYAETEFNISKKANTFSQIIRNCVYNYTEP